LKVLLLRRIDIKTWEDKEHSLLEREYLQD